MAEKKKTTKKVNKKETVEKVKSTKEKKIEEKKIVKSPNAGEELWVKYTELPDRVLGKVYDYKGQNARLVYINEKCKLIVE